MRVTVIGAEGFVGSAFVRYFKNKGAEVQGVTRSNYEGCTGQASDIVIEAACNSKKYFAEQEPFNEFASSVTHRLETLRDFPADLHVHISSVDVYADLTSPSTTREDVEVDVQATSNYGFHKFLAEELVRRYADRWLILRLAGMVGPGLRKNPVFDILNGMPIRIHPESRYQFMHTDRVAEIAGQLVDRGLEGEVLNVCGQGLITPKQIAELSGKSLDTSALPDNCQPRIVEASHEKLAQYVEVPSTLEAVQEFLAAGK